MEQMLLNEISEFITDELNLSVNDTEIEQLHDKLQVLADFYIEIDGQDYRFIEEQYIWDIYVDEIKQITEDCYDLKMPDWLAVDWEETAQNCFVDGYGHTFAHYDGNEIEYEFDKINYYIFRV